jgi:hypothetical protein
MLGGEGTPEVLEFAVAELGARLETTTGSARAFVADALDLRHRLPELWQLIRAGQVRAWRARKVAQATRHLSLDSAKQVDAAVAQAIVGLPWNRFEMLLSAKIIEADPKAAEEQAKIWEAERFVRSRSTEQSGLKLLIARANAGDVIWFMATVNRLAEILRLRGDFDSADVRRSKAIGVLAQGSAGAGVAAVVGLPPRAASLRRIPTARRADRQRTRPGTRSVDKPIRRALGDGAV